jgi:hypothetical protein
MVEEAVGIVYPWLGRVSPNLAPPEHACLSGRRQRPSHRLPDRAAALGRSRPRSDWPLDILPVPNGRADLCISSWAMTYPASPSAATSSRRSGTSSSASLPRRRPSPAGVSLPADIVVVRDVFRGDTVRGTSRQVLIPTGEAVVGESSTPFSLTQDRGKREECDFLRFCRYALRRANAA